METAQSWTASSRYKYVTCICVRSLTLAFHFVSHCCLWQLKKKKKKGKKCSHERRNDREDICPLFWHGFTSNVIYCPRKRQWKDLVLICIYICKNSSKRSRSKIISYELFSVPNWRMTFPMSYLRTFVFFFFFLSRS